MIIRSARSHGTLEGTVLDCTEMRSQNMLSQAQEVDWQSAAIVLSLDLQKPPSYMLLNRHIAERSFGKHHKDIQSGPSFLYENVFGIT